MTRWRAGLMAVAVPSLVNLAIVGHGYDGGPYLRGDCPYYYAAAESIWRDHDLDLANNLPGPIAAHAGNVAIAQDGRVVPKHPILLALASAPLIAAFGPRGALTFNLIQFAVALALAFVLACEVAPPLTACLATILIYGGSFMPAYAWNYSPDLFAAMLLVGSVVAARHVARGRAVACTAGLLGGLAIAAKMPLALIVPAILALLLPLNRRTVTAAVAGMALPLAALAMLDTHLFGRPLLTGYDFILAIRPDGMPAMYSQRSTFDNPIWRGIWGQFIDPRHGLLRTSPVVIAAWLGGWRLARRSLPLAAYAASASVALFLFYATYSPWDASHYGNRFLMPVVLLAVLPLAALLDFRTPGHRGRTSTRIATAG
jgi:hypothetical protein